MRHSILAILVLVPLLPGEDAEAVPFGRNKVQYDTFEWQVLETEHLEVHFYSGERALAERAAAYGEEACSRLDEALTHTLTKRIPVLVYSSHYHFRQNNVTPSLVGESTGGFTEIFRTRVALPYSGSEENFRHVIHHELVHAYCFDLLYGGPVKSLFVLQYAFHLPLWFVEGIAEYYSNRWDSEAEMMIRDAAVSGRLPPFPRIHGGYFVYKAGRSAIEFLVERHGEGCIPRILDDLKETRNITASVKNVTGESVEELGREWLEAVRRRTWPTVAHLHDPDDLGRPLTSHATEGGRINSNPTVSPSGSKVVFLSDRSGTPDLWVMGLGDESNPEPPRALVRGARGGKFESLHRLRSSVGWSPDERYLVVAAQREARDAIYVLDAMTGRTAAEFLPPLDAVERPDWSSTTARFVFTGMKSGRVDLYAMDADGTGFVRVTDDLYEERGPRWSPDGRLVAFASDRTDSTGLDVWMLDVETGTITALRRAPGDQWDPAWSADGQSIYHASDEFGTRDLMVTNRGTGETRRLSGLLGGVDSPSLARDSNRLVLAAYDGGGWNLVLVEDADTLTTVEAPAVPIEPPSGETPAGAPDSRAAADGKGGSEKETAEPVLRDYRPRFRTEWITGALAYSGYGLNGAVQTSVSDVLGNHRFHLGTSVFRSLESSDAFLTYSYLPRRLDWIVGAFHVKDFLYDDRTTLGQPIGEEGDDAFFSERRWGVTAAVTYPFHTFRRIGLEVAALNLERVRFTEESRELGENREEIGESSSRLVIPRLYHTFDNTLWGWTGPVQGRRSVLSLEQSIPLGGSRVSYGTVLGDVRLYHRFAPRYIVAWRATAAVSYGPDPQEFQLGGVNTIRGYRFQEIRGRHTAMLSAEFRYPFVDHVQLGWPFRTAFGGIRGNLFLDLGTAFDDPGHWRLGGTDADGRPGLEDLHVGFGVGARARIAHLPLRLDLGWPTDGSGVGSPRWHFTIGPEY
jgi:Tol biopolymer transport system component